jgi:malonyl-ACP decarboxylase
MNHFTRESVVVTGIGVTSSIGQGRQEFEAALLEGRHAFRVMQRPGRQKDSAFIGAELAALRMAPALSTSALRMVSLSAQAALVTVHEAWHDANLGDVDPSRIGLIVGGSNFQQRELMLIHEAYADRVRFLRPTYALAFMDSDACGVCTQQFGIRGLAFTVGGACASGQLAVLQAMQAVSSGQVDACIAVGALTDLSYWECQALRSIGAMGSDRYADRPELACRPYDEHRDGFILGENCGAVVIERAGADRSGTRPYAALTGYAVVMDAHRDPDPSLEGEIKVIRDALARAGLAPKDIDYVNPHGTGSRVGDDIELRALTANELGHAYINATKSIIGHGFSAAGTVELIAILVQMQASQLHPSRNLDAPIRPELNWVRDRPVMHTIQNALNLSLGFGGVNTALCLQRLPADRGRGVSRVGSSLASAARP